MERQDDERGKKRGKITYTYTLMYIALYRGNDNGCNNDKI